MKDRHPVFQLSDDEIAVYESNAGYLFSELCIQSYIYMAKECGAALHFDETMLSWHQQDTRTPEETGCPLVAVQTGADCRGMGHFYIRFLAALLAGH